MIRKTAILLSACFVLSACATSNQASPGTVRRLVTVPSGAEIYIKRLGYKFHSPLDLSQDIRSTDTLTIHLPGYDVWEKQLSEAWQPAKGTYRVVLKPKDED